VVQPDRAKNRRVALISLTVFAAMVGLTYASVPLYRLFCQTTGYNGTVRRAEQAPGATSSRTIKIRFDANVAATLGWKFHPDQLEMKVKLGEQTLAHYVATNTTGASVTGSAIFNVTPESAGAYFNKIQCFCFTEQTLQPGQSTDLPVSFFVDPAIVNDPDTSSIDTITLSYTFYPVDKPKSVSQAAAPAAPRTN
jgi:cytochrome c oxidase assembly protein subunit 11